MSVQKTRDGSHTLYSKRYAQTYGSDKGALTEALHVFLEATDVAPKLRHGETVRVLEVGFGTGLNFFLTADLSLEYHAPLQYSALEQHLLSVDTFLALSYRPLLKHPSLFDGFLSWRESVPEEGTQTFAYEGVGLELLLGEATTQTLPEGFYDAVYMDAFSPDANPELWTESFLVKLYTALRSGGILSTYCVKGEVRRRLQSLGFTVEKRPGPPDGKRQMLYALKPDSRSG